MPTAIPSWRKVLLIPEASPTWSAESTPTIAAASAGLMIPIASPPTTKPGSRCVHEDVVSRPRISHSAIAIRASPVTSGARSPMRPVSRPETGATTSSTSVSGSSRRPVSVAE